MRTQTQNPTQKDIKNLTFFDGKDNWTFVRKSGNTVWLRNEFASMQSVKLKHLLDERYFMIIE